MMNPNQPNINPTDLKPIPVFRCDDCGHVPEEFRPVTPSK